MPEPMAQATAQPVQHHPDGIDIGGWSVRAHRGPIASTPREAEIASELGIKLPGMLFDASALRMTHLSSGTELCFQTIDALRGVGPVDPAIRVKAAKVWDARKAPRDVEISVLQGASDWTFTTKYGGAVTTRDASDAEAGFSVADAVKIDYDALRQTDVPILFFDEIILFEDELDDNGIASYRVRIRVMPEQFFVLARFFLRVDDVIIRVYDTRYYHKFGSDRLVCERSTREAPFETLKDTVPCEVLRNPDQLAAAMPLVSSVTENLKF